MKGVLTRDRYLLLHTCLFFIIMPLAAAVLNIGIAIKGGSCRLTFFMFANMIMCLTPVTVFTSDLYKNYLAYELTMPCRRSQIVSSKYVMGLLINACVTVFYLITAGICLGLGGTAKGEIINSLLYTVAAGFYPISVFMPVYAAMADKPRATKQVIGGLVGAFIGGFTSIISQRIAESGVRLGSALVFFIVSLAIFMISLPLSIFFYDRKDIA